MPQHYTAVIERTKPGYLAYLVDVPGCVATGQTREEALDLLRVALRAHMRRLREIGEAIPAPLPASVVAVELIDLEETAD